MELWKVAIGVVLIVVVGCSSEMGEQTPALPLADEVVQDFSMEESLEGRRQWLLTADSAFVFEGKGVTVVYGVKVTFYDENGNESSWLSGDSGMVWRSEELWIGGEVKLLSSDSLVLRTHSLRWDPKKNLVWTEDTVYVEGQGISIVGKGVEADPSMKELKVLEGIKGAVEREE